MMLTSSSALLLAGRKGRVGPARKCQGLLFGRGPRITLFDSWEEPKPGGSREEGKQRPAVPPARRGFPHLAMPARTGWIRRRYRSALNRETDRRRIRSAARKRAGNNG